MNLLAVKLNRNIVDEACCCEGDALGIFLTREHSKDFYSSLEVHAPMVQNVFTMLQLTASSLAWSAGRSIASVLWKYCIKWAFRLWIITTCLSITLTQLLSFHLTWFLLFDQTQQQNLVILSFSFLAPTKTYRSCCRAIQVVLSTLYPAFISLLYL